MFPLWCSQFHPVLWNRHAETVRWEPRCLYDWNQKTRWRHGKCLHGLQADCCLQSQQRLVLIIVPYDSSLLLFDINFSSKLLESTTMPTWCKQRALCLPTVLQHARLHFELQSPYHSWVEGEYDGLRGRYWPLPWGQSNPRCTVIMPFVLRWAAHSFPSYFRHIQTIM